MDRIHGLNSHHIAEATFKAVAPPCARRSNPIRAWRGTALDQGGALMRVALVDYDSGNLHSAEKAFALMGRRSGPTWS